MWRRRSKSQRMIWSEKRRMVFSSEEGRYVKSQINSDLWRVITIYTVSVWPFPSDRCTSLTCLKTSDVRSWLSVTDDWRVRDDPEMLVTRRVKVCGARKHNRIRILPWSHKKENYDAVIKRIYTIRLCTFAQIIRSEIEYLISDFPGKKTIHLKYASSYNCVALQEFSIGGLLSVKNC